MSSGNQFEDKATRLMNRLSSVASPLANRTKIEGPRASVQEISRLKDQIECSELETRKKLKGLGETLRRLEGSLIEQGQLRAQKDETFTQTVSKLQKNMRTVLSNVQKGFADRQKKLAEKIDLLIKTERKDLQGRLRDNEELMDQMQGLQSKIAAIVDEVTALRRARVELEDRINRQFAQQIRQLKRIFESDVRARQEKEQRVIEALKGVYKNGMERVYLQQKEREQSQKMLMGVIQQLVEHIIQT